MMKVAVTMSQGSSTWVSPFGQGVDEQQAHAVDGEDLLGDDQPAEQGADVDGHHRHQRDEGVAQGVLVDHLAWC